jgi:hypothetical protein
MRLLNPQPHRDISPQAVRCDLFRYFSIHRPRHPEGRIPLPRRCVSTLALWTPSWTARTGLLRPPGLCRHLLWRWRQDSEESIRPHFNFAVRGSSLIFMEMWTGRPRLIAGGNKQKSLTPLRDPENIRVGSGTDTVHLMRRRPSVDDRSNCEHFPRTPLE